MSDDAANFRPYEQNLPDGVKHLHGSMYLVRFDLLTLPDPDVTVENNTEYEFRNPRSLTEKGASDLFDKRKSAVMRESIKDKTLMTPFIARWVKSGDGLVVQVVGGERRRRALDYLIRKKEMVKDPQSVKLNDKLTYEYEYRPADQVYSHVLCQIYAVANDIEALAFSYTENDCRINQGPGHDIAMVQELRKCNASDEKIMSTMTKDEKWLRDTDALIAGLGDNLKDLIEDRIDREAALEILAVKEKHGDEIVAKAVAVAFESSQKDYKKKFDKLTRSISEARDEEEIAEGSIVDAQFRQDEEAETEAKENLDKAQAKVKRTLSERDREKATTKRSHIRDGVKAVTGQPGKSLALRGPKIQDCYIAPLEKLLQNNGCDPDNDYVASPNSLNLALKLCRGIFNGEEDCLEIIRLHYKKISVSVGPDDDPDMDE